MENLHTKCGEIKGLELENSISYRGIRYATAGMFEYPKVVEKWDGVYDATKYGDCCYQRRTFYDEASYPEKAFYYKEFRKDATFSYSNDCLFLNIWTPKDTTDKSLLPVIVYIHGGGFTGGSGNEKHFDGPKWCEQGVIAVTINYRLGPWGFICLPELAEEAGHTGNYGIFDMIAALNWVKSNIKEFGGNPINITVMGQSAGAMCIQQLCLSPITKGLFQKAVMSSGAGVNPLLNVNRKPEKNYWFWEMVKKEAGCDTAEGLRKVEPKLIYDAFEKVKVQDKPNLICYPCLDGVFMVNTSYEALVNKEIKNIPYMVGSNKNDILSPVIHKMAKAWCKDTDNGKTYCYFFERDIPGDDRGAWHSGDLWYWFGTYKNGWRQFEDRDVILSNVMIQYLCNFARTGNPNGPGLGGWETTTKFDRHVMIFGNKKIGMGKPSMLKLIKIMLTKKAAIEG